MKYIRVQMKTIGLVAASLVTILSFAQDIKWQVDNTVYSSVMLGNELYLGGNFTYIGKYTGTAVVIPEAAGNVPVSSTPKINVTGLTPSINSIIPDGQNGYFIAGNISYIDDAPVSPSIHILHVRKDAYGNIYTDWSVNTNGRVNCLFLLGTTLYAGGVFSSVSGWSGTFTRRNIAAINSADGSITSWNPGFGSAGTGVFAIAGSGSVVYVGGGFTFGSFSNLAAINASTAASAWSVPNNPNNTVRALALSGTKLFVGGDFSNAGTLARKAIAAVNISDGTTVTGFDAGSTAPGGTNAIRSLVVSTDGATLYIGGSFSGFQSRNHLMAVSAGTGTATSWNPNPAAAVNSIALSGNRLYVGGTFSSSTGSTTIGGKSRNYIAAISTVTGQEDDGWVTLTNGIVNYISVGDGNVYLGGEFTSAGGAKRNRVAAIDYVNGAILPWNPDANGAVMALINYNGSIYAGGDFTNIGGQPRQRMASLNKTDGAATPGWSADANATVRTLYAGNGSIYAGGDFTTIGGQSRNRIAKLKATDGAVVSTWNPNADNIVRAINGYEEKIFAGGDFDNIGGQSRSKIAALDSNGTGSSLLSWYPAGGASGTTSSVPCRVNTIAVREGIIYAGGSFAGMGGQSKKNIAAIDNSGAIVSGFTVNPNSANEVNIIYPSGNFLYVGGSFNDIKTNTRHKHLSEIDPATGDPSLSFYASPGAAVYTIAVNLFTMYFGGAFPNYIPDFSFPVGRNSYLSFHTANGGMIALQANVTRFDVKQYDDKRIIQWQADDKETANTFYEVQRSAGNPDFTTIRTQRADKSFNRLYQAEDNDYLEPGTYYYRLKITEAGRTAYSSVKPIIINEETGTKLFPTVINNGYFSVTTSSPGLIRLYNTGGQMVSARSLQKGLNKLLTGNLSKGVYHYIITDKENGSRIMGKIMIY